MQEKNNLSVCIVTYNSQDKISAAVSSLKAHTKDISYKLYVFDNNSKDSTEQVVKETDSDALFTPTGGNIGFGKANNMVLPLINSKYHAIVNPDIRIENDVLSDMCKYLDEHTDVVMATPKILFPNGSEQHLPKKRPKLVYMFSRRLPFLKSKAREYTMENVVITEPIEVDMCSGCFMLIRTDVFKKLGGFDDRFFMYMEDADLTLRAKAYGKTMFLPQFHVIHEWERSSSKSLKYFMIHVCSMFKFILKHRKRR